MTAIAARLADVRARIARAAGRAGRDPASVRLIAVSKTFPVEHVREAAAAGQIDFGENKVQEALPKIDAFRSGGGAPDVRWHLIGHLQSNKAKKAGASFDAVHSVDSASLLQRIDEGAATAGSHVDLLVQVDLAGEATKFGARESELKEIFAAAELAKHVSVVGLMLLPPAVEDPEGARPYFRELIAVRKRLLDQGIDPRMLDELSMGMSQDFEVAVEEGATMVRVGSAIFGHRTYSGV